MKRSVAICAWLVAFPALCGAETSGRDEGSPAGGDLVGFLATAGVPPTGWSARSTVTVTSPSGGETWPAGSTHTITWTSTDPEGDVYLDLYKGSQYVQYLGQAAMAAGMFVWEVCPTIGDGTNYNIHLWGIDEHGAWFEEISGTFAITGSLPHPTVTPTSPVAGETWPAGSTQTITWTSTGATGNVWMDIYKGGYYVENVGYVPVADGMIGWAVCPTIGDGTDYKVVLEWVDCGSYVRSTSAAFAITGSAAHPMVTLTSPVGGETWAAGSTQTITWNSTNPAGDVWADLYKGGQYAEFLGFKAMAAGTLTWDICPAIGDGTDYVVEVGWIDCESYVRATSGPFAITGSIPHPAVTLNSPVGGETWAAGSTQTITWSSTNPTGSVWVDLYRGSYHAQSLGYVPMADGAFTWDICPAIGDGTNYVVEVGWIDCGSYMRATSGPLAITGSAAHPTATLTNPVGGETWPAGSTQTITWSSTNPSGDVWVDLYKGGSHFRNLGRAPMADGTFAWDICPAIGDGTDYVVELGWSDCGSYVSRESGPLAISGSVPHPAVTLTSPIGGEVWPAASTQVITWSSTSAIGSVRVDVYKGGQYVDTIGLAPMADGMLAWDICPRIGDGTDYTVEIGWDDCGSWNRVVSGSLAISGSMPRPTLALTSPVGGETWLAGTTQTITWNSTNPTGSVWVGLYQGAEFIQSIGYVPMKDGMFTWGVCPAIGDGTGYTVEVGWYECGPDLQATSGPIAITGSFPRPTLTLTSPIGGETWPAGTTQTITWSSTNAVGRVDLWLERENGSWRWIGDAAMAAGAYSWPVSPYLGDANYAMYVEWSGCGPSITRVNGYLAVTGSHRSGDCDGDGDVDLTDYGILEGCLLGPLVVAGADFNSDGDVDLGDFERWRPCLAGPGVAQSGNCRVSDLDGDEDVDLADFARLTRAFTGEEYPLSAGCAAGDFDIDRDVDFGDFATLQRAFGR